MTIKQFKDWLADNELSEDEEDFEGDDPGPSDPSDATDQVHNQGGFTAQTSDGKKFLNLHKVVKSAKSKAAENDEVFRASKIKPSDTVVSVKANPQTPYGQQGGIAAEELTNEDQLDELSKRTLNRYHKKATADLNAAKTDSRYYQTQARRTFANKYPPIKKGGLTYKMNFKDAAKQDSDISHHLVKAELANDRRFKRADGVARASDRLQDNRFFDRHATSYGKFKRYRAEELEPLDELYGKGSLRKIKLYHKKDADDKYSKIWHSGELAATLHNQHKRTDWWKAQQHVNRASMMQTALLKKKRAKEAFADLGRFNPSKKGEYAYSKEDIQDGVYEMISEADYQGKKYSRQAITHINIKGGKPADTEDEVKLALAKVKGPVRLRYRGPHSRTTTWARYGSGGETHKAAAHGAAVYRATPRIRNTNPRNKTYGEEITNEAHTRHQLKQARELHSLKADELLRKDSNWSTAERGKKFGRKVDRHVDAQRAADRLLNVHAEQLEAFKYLVLNEVTPPGMEDEAKKMKSKFKQLYGEDYKKVLYATLWKRYNKEENELNEIYGKGTLEKIADFHKKHEKIAGLKLQAAELEHGEDSDDAHEHWQAAVTHDAGRQHAQALMKLRSAAKAHKDAKLGVKMARAEHPWKG